MIKNLCTIVEDWTDSNLAKFAKSVWRFLKMCKKCVAFPKNVHTNATSLQKCDETFLQKCATWYLHNVWSFLTKKKFYFREFAEAYSARNAFIAFYWLDECLSKLRGFNWNLLNDCFCSRNTLYGSVLFKFPHKLKNV